MNNWRRKAFNLNNNSVSSSVRHCCCYYYYCREGRFGGAA